MQPSPRSSRFALFALVYALTGWLAFTPLVGMWVWGFYAMEQGDTDPMHAAIMSSAWLACYALVGLVVSGAAVLRVGLDQEVWGQRWAWFGVLSNLAFTAPAVAGMGMWFVMLIWWLQTIRIGCGSPGRPLRVEGRAWWGTFRHSAGRAREVRPRVAWAWARSASSERSAVGAFEHLADDLGALGAPLELVGRCRVAAQQEQRHTELSLGLVERFVGMRLVPEPMPTAPPATLEQLAVSSLVDGVAGEGFAAALAAGAADRVDDPEVARILAEIARDEAEHAELSADILSWCLAQGGAPVARALAAVRPPPLSPAPTQPIEGGLPLAEQKVLYAAAWARAVSPPSSSSPSSSPSSPSCWAAPPASPAQAS